MQVSNENTVWLFTNPKELRELADKMEAVIPKLLPGDSCIVDTISSPKVQVRIAWDQEKRKD